MPLAPKLVMAETRGVYAGPVTITVLIPAHNEAGCIAATIASLRAQSSSPERIIVVADNCTDDTVPIARAAGVEVVETVGNQKKKAGALNQSDGGGQEQPQPSPADDHDRGRCAGVVKQLPDAHHGG